MSGKLEQGITTAILDASHDLWKSLLELDVIIVGGGPSGLTAAKYLADARVKVAVLERHLSFGGGTWGGGMGHPQIVVDGEALGILDEFKVGHRESTIEGLHVVNSVELPARLGIGAIEAGAQVVTAVEVEDVMVDEERVRGVVINGTAICRAGLHVDPLALAARYVIDATGHEASVAAILARKNPDTALTVPGERSMWAEKGEHQLAEYTRELYPGLFVAGMAANAVQAGYRMGAIFSGMLLSGRKCAEEIVKRLG